MDDISFDSMQTTFEPVVKQGGNAEISDEEMDALTHDDGDAKESAKRDLASKVDKDTKEKRDEADEGKKAAKEVEQEASTETKQEIKARTFKIKNGDADLDIRDDALVPVKIDGKVTNVPVKDLLAEFSGKTDWTRKYQELHNDKTSFYTERDQVNNRINEFYRLSVEEKNPRMAIEFLAESMGANPQEVWENLINPVKEKWKTASTLSPEELSAKERDEELEHYRRKEAMHKSSTEKARETEDLISRVKNTQAKYGMDQAQFKSCYDDMVAEAARANFDVKNLTPEMVGEYFQIVDRKTKLKGFVYETYQDSDKTEEIEKQLYETWAQNPAFSLDDIKEIGAQVFGSPKTKTQRLAARVRGEAKTAKVLPQHEPLNWDDL